MKIRNINVKIPVVATAAVVFFTILLFVTYLLTQDFSLLIWGIPTIVILFLIPVALNYMSQSSYLNVIPEYERTAKTVRIKGINLNMIGQSVRFEGVVVRVYFRYLNRPQYLIADKSGEISVKMFTSPQEDVQVDDVVEVLGQVIRRYFFTGDAVVNCVRIRRIGKGKKSENEKK
jgi:RecJ-like exonuclease